MPTQWRVNYSLFAAGGRMWPTYSIVTADTAEEAISEAERRQRRSDADSGRANVGYFNNDNRN